MRSRPNRIGPTLALSLSLAAAFLCGIDPAQAQPEGVSYTLTPIFNDVRWNDEIGLEDTGLYGGRLGVNFGRLVSLQGFYLTRNDVKTRLAGIDLSGPGTPLPDRKLDVSNYGVDLTLSLGAGRAVPFLRGGGGILSFNPARGDAIRQINMKAGGGFRFGFRRFQAEVFAEDSAFRIDRYQLAEPPAAGSYPADPDADRIRHNLSMGAGLTFFLGGTRESRLSETDRALLERYRHGLSGLSVPVEVFASRLDFSDDLAIDNQVLMGLRTGLDFGRYFGLRGYYWRGLNDDFDETMRIQSWGGEARFNLNSGQGAVPYLVTGVGQLDFMDGFLDERGTAPDDKTVLILGGGLGFRLSDRFELDLSARDYLLSAKDLDDTAKPDDLVGNWMFGAAVRFSLGGSSPHGQRPLFGEAEAPPAGPPPPWKAMEPEELDWTPEPRAEKRPGKVLLRAPAKGSVVGYAGERMITIPVPTEGEIYIRYGSPGGVNIESRSVTGEAAAPPAQQPPATSSVMTPTPAPPAPDLETIRLVIRDELRRAGVVREPGEDAPETRWVEKEGASTPRRIVFEEQAPDDAEVRDEEPGDDDGGGWKPVGFRLYTGLGLDDPAEFLLGGRVNLGPIVGGSPFLFVPEAALGLGDDFTTYLVAGNLQLPLGNLGGSRQWSPYASAGLGFLKADSGGESDTDLTVNFGLGVDAHFGGWVPFLEYQGVRGFDLNRLLVGVRIRQ